MASNNEWKIFEKLVFNIQKLKYSNAVITYDDKIRDVITKRSRQVDISIKFKQGNKNELIVIECKQYNNKTLNQPNVEQFVSFIKSVGADKGIMVAAQGYSKSAKIYAAAMDVDLFNLEEANQIEWNEYIKAVSIPIIKKRFYNSNIQIHTGNKIIKFDKQQFLLGKEKYELYKMDNGEYISMMNFRKKYPEHDFDFFQNMPNLHDHIIEWVEDQTTAKLDSSKSSEYDQIKNIITKETGQLSWQSRLIHIFHDDISEIEPDPEIKLSWASQIWQMDRNPRTGEEIEPSKYLKINNTFLPIRQISLVYRVEISLRRYKDGEEISELDLNKGMVYLDINKNKKEFFFLSDISK
jgi:hypothetical protein